MRGAEARQVDLWCGRVKDQNAARSQPRFKNALRVARDAGVSEPFATLHVFIGQLGDDVLGYTYGACDGQQAGALLLHALVARLHVCNNIRRVVACLLHGLLRV